MTVKKNVKHIQWLNPQYKKIKVQKKILQGVQGVIADKKTWPSLHILYSLHITPGAAFL